MIYGNVGQIYLLLIRTLVAFYMKRVLVWVQGENLMENGTDIFVTEQSASSQYLSSNKRKAD